MGKNVTERRIPKEEESQKTKTLKRIPLRTAQRVAKLRKKTGQANLNIVKDEESSDLPKDEKMCWVEADELDKNEEEGSASFAAQRKHDAALTGFDERWC